LQDFGIDLNSADNGLYLPSTDYPGRTASLHSGGPTDAYTNYVNKELSQATNKADALRILDGLKTELRNGTLKINNK
jgi:hypothetical protein